MDSMPNLTDAPSLKDTPRGSAAATPAPGDLAGAEDALAKLAMAARAPQPRAAPADFSAGLRAAAPPPTAAQPSSDLPARAGKAHASDWREPTAETEPRRGAAGATLRFLFAAGLGVGATLLWQSSYGEGARHLVADYVPFAWTAPAAPTAEAEPVPIAATADTPAPSAASTAAQASATPAGATLAATASEPTPATPPPPATTELTAQIAALTHDLAAMRDSVDKLAAGHDQMARAIAKLEAADEELRHKPAPPPRRPPARRPLAAAPPPPQPAPQSIAPALPPPRPIAPPANAAHPAATTLRPPAGLP